MCRYALGMGNPGDHSLLSCPRCGYDLTPMVPAPGPARDAVGKCSECGLGFTWNGLFDALRQLLPRFVEHSKGFRATAIAIFWTLAWLILPHRFWRRITIERKVRLPRAVLWLVVLIPLTRLSETLVIFLANAWASWLPHIADVSMIPTMAELWYDLSEVFTARANSGYYDQGEPPLAIIATLLSLFAALMFLILPQTRRQAKVRTALVIRCWVYSHALLAALYMWNLVSITFAGFVPYSGWQRWGFSPWGADHRRAERRRRLSLRRVPAPWQRDGRVAGLVLVHGAALASHSIGRMGSRFDGARRNARDHADSAAVWRVPDRFDHLARHVAGSIVTVSILLLNCC